MGLGNSGNRVYVSIMDGKVVIKAKEGDEGAVSRINKDGAIVWEKRYGNISGVLKNISITSNVFNGAEIKSWVFDIMDGRDSFSLQVQYDSRYATSLLFALCNPDVDFDKPIQINPWMKQVGEKKKTACFVTQGGDNIEWYFTKDDPKGMPEWKVLKVKGKDIWDNYDAMQFLESFVKTNIIPQLGGAIDDGNLPPTYTKPGDVEGNSTTYIPDLSPDNDDDLPF